MSSTTTSTYTRKRTCSFSTPSLPTSHSSKKKRISATTFSDLGPPIKKMGIPAHTTINAVGNSSLRGCLKRSETCWDLQEQKTHYSASIGQASSSTGHRSARQHKDQRDASHRHRQRKVSTESESSQYLPSMPMPQHATINSPYAPRTPSPLSPSVAPSFSYEFNSPRRSSKKTSPDLYKQAIITRMKCSPDGARMLHMGPRLALSIMEATNDLERLVGGLGAGSAYGNESHSLETQDVVMNDRDSFDSKSSSSSPFTTTISMTQSWVLLSGEAQSQGDWEMVY